MNKTRGRGQRRFQRHRTTRKSSRSTTQYGILSPLQHHHLLLRLETKHCPGPSAVQKESSRLQRIVKDLGMKPLDTPKIYYLDTPSWNKGLTGIVPIQTSHIAFHFWSTPDKNIFHNSNSRCLLQLDIYTCGALPHDVVPILLREVEEFEPTHLDCTVFNRKYKLLKELEVHWDAQEENWESWIGSFSDRKS